MIDVTTARLDLTREQILAYRLSVNGLTERQPLDPTSLRRAAWAGLQDSMPRAAVLSLHARLQGVGPASWEDPSLVQLWGPRFSAYVVPARDLAVFSLGRLPTQPRAVRRRGSRRPTGRLPRRPTMTLRGGRRRARRGAEPAPVRRRNRTRPDPVGWRAPAGDLDSAGPGGRPGEARLELARRYLHVFGPGTTSGFAGWAGIAPADGAAAFDALAGSLTAVRTPVGDRLILTVDESTFRSPGGPAASARLLPSGDAYFLLWGADRELLVPAAVDRQRLWTSRVWPGAVLVDGEIVGTWRRAKAEVVISSWRRLSPAEREAIEAEATAMPLADIQQIRVRWET